MEFDVYKEFGKTRRGGPKRAFAGVASLLEDGGVKFVPDRTYQTYWDTKRFFSNVDTLYCETLNSVEHFIGGDVHFLRRKP